jgi:8-oxo-dGTP diphosphatase
MSDDARRGGPVTVVAAAIVDDLGRPERLLAARRSTPAALAGRWEFAGGKVDDGETCEDALHRELLEELGVQVTLGPEVVGPDDGGWEISSGYVLRLWLATVTAGEPHPLVEHDEVRWLQRGAWLSVPWLDADVRIVQELAARVGGRFDGRLEGRADGRADGLR